MLNGFVEGIELVVALWDDVAAVMVVMEGSEGGEDGEIHAPCDAIELLLLLALVLALILTADRVGGDRVVLPRKDEDTLLDCEKIMGWVPGPLGVGSVSPAP